MSGFGTVIAYIFKSSINSGVVAMVGGLVIVPIISLCTKKLDAKEVDKMFECFDEKVTVAKKEALD